MLLALGMIGIGFVSGWSSSGSRPSLRNLLVFLTTMAVVAVETKTICPRVSLSVVCFAMASALGLRYLFRAVLGTRQTT
jgi:hypothetical protein